MNTLLKLALILIFLLSLSGCQSAWGEPFPNAEIVYQGSLEQSQIGFVNADGSNPVKIKLGQYLVRPIWGEGNTRIYALAQGSQSLVTGYPSYWEQKQSLRKCEDWYLAVQIEPTTPDKPLAILWLGTKISLVDLEKCAEVKVLVVPEPGTFIQGVSYLPEQNVLLYGLETGKSISESVYQILRLDVTTNQVEVLAQGINPSWSPDGTRIAYVQADGIYGMNADGTQPQRLVAHTFVNADGNFGGINPAPRWSPDGAWLVYHRCESYSCYLEESSIYKVEVTTGKEQKIVDGGIYPDWRK